MSDLKIKRTVASNLRTWMDANPNLETQSKLAKKSGVGQRTISRILNEEVDPGVCTLDEIARAFGKTASDLLADGSESAPEGFEARREGLESLDAEDLLDLIDKATELLRASRN